MTCRQRQYLLQRPGLQGRASSQRDLAGFEVDFRTIQAALQQDKAPQYKALFVLCIDGQTPGRWIASQS